MAAGKLKFLLGSHQKHIEMCHPHHLPADVICEDCNVFICGRCAKVYHREHDWISISTAAIERGRGLLEFLGKIKEEDLPVIDEKMKRISKQISENEDLCDSDIKNLQKHCDETMIITKLSEIRKHHEQRLKDNLKEKNEKLKSVKSELEKKKKEITETVTFMEDSKSAMSDYSLIDNKKELTQLLSGLDVDIKKYKHSVRYSKGEISDEVLEIMLGKTLHIEDISLTETSSFKYGNETIVMLKALSEDQCYIRQMKSVYTEQVNKEGKKKHKYNIQAHDIFVADTGDVYYIDFENNSISCLSPSGSVSTVISTDPLQPRGICQSVDSGLLVTLRDKESDLYKLDSHSRRLVRHITVTGDVIHEYEYQEDGQSKLFTFPTRITQNSNSDICVVNRTSYTTGDLMIISPSGLKKSVYRGQNLRRNFNPAFVVCDSLCNILVTELNKKQIHLLTPDGEFFKFLLRENVVNLPYSLSMYKSTLWVGYREGLVKVFQYKM